LIYQFRQLSIYLAANSFAAVVRKSAKYATLATTHIFMPMHIFMPIALETLGTMNTEALDFFADLGRRIAANSNDNRETSFLFQRLSVIVQRYNAVAFRGSFVLETYC
jgi:hypothetical protein